VGDSEPIFAACCRARADRGCLVRWRSDGASRRSAHQDGLSRARPDFAVVTGASIGALIGYYAFLGARYDEELGKNFTDITAADIFEDKATPESLFDTWPLRRLVEKRVTHEMFRRCGRTPQGRRFLVATTNLDAGRRVIWNMGDRRTWRRARLKLFRDVLLASQAFRDSFQPVAIEVEANGKRFQELHLDGTVTSPFFVMPESMFATSEARSRRARSM